jgi:hypothetical protein
LPYLSGSSSRKIQPQEGFKTSLKSPKYCDWKRCNKSGRKVTKLELAPEHYIETYYAKNMFQGRRTSKELQAGSISNRL